MTTALPKYLVGVLYYGAVDYEHASCMKRLAQHPRVLNILELTGCPYICIGRSTLAQAAFDNSEAEGLLFIDHDIIFDGDAISQILESCDQTRGVVGAGYSMRSPGSKMIGGIDTTRFEKENPGKKVVFFEGGGIYPALYLGMGFTAIHRDAIAAIAPSLPVLDNGVTRQKIRPYFSLLQEEGKYYGEDVSFCLRATRAHVPVDMDTRVRVWHKGSYTYGLEDCGIVVPFMSRLEGVLADDPQAMLSAHSPHPEVRRALQGETAPEACPVVPTASILPSVDPTTGLPSIGPSWVYGSPGSWDDDPSHDESSNGANLARSGP